MNWSERSPLQYVVTDMLPRGYELRRCYLLSRGPAAFHAAGNVRFGAAPRSMLYTGDTDAAAVAETLLRDPRPWPGTRLIALPYDHLKDRGLATLRLKRPARFISLRRPRVHAVLHDPYRIEQLRLMIESNGNYDASQEFARAVLNQVPTLNAMSWPSRRVDGETVFCFYGGDLTEADFDVVETSAFRTPMGYERLAAAVEACGLTLFRDHPVGTPNDDDS